MNIDAIKQQNMPPVPQLTPTERGRILAWKEDGWSDRDIAKKLSCAHGTVSKIYGKFKRTGSAYAAPRSGRPTIVTPRLKARFRRAILAQPCKVWADFVDEFGVSKETLRRVAASMGYHKRVMRSRPYLTPKHLEKRLEWARDNEHTNWKAVLYTDEAAIEIGE